MTEPEHDLSRATDSLVQCLMQDKRPLAMFLGAGSPKSVHIERDNESQPLIPDVAGLTELVVARLSATEHGDALTRMIAGLRADQAADPTVEDMLTRLRSLSAVAGSATVRDLTGLEISQLEEAITDQVAQAAKVDLPVGEGPYQRLAAWVGSAARAYPITLFTTNYDMLQEQALERRGIPFFDGFVGALEPFLDNRSVEGDELPTRWARVWKLHGSVNWKLLETGRVVRGHPTSGQRRLIHPSHLKYDESRRMPYLLMHDRLRGFLAQPSAVLVTIGYSFRDDHINELIAEGLDSNLSAITFGLLHGELSGYEKGLEVAKRCANLVLLARDRACIGTRVGSWIAGGEQNDSSGSEGEGTTEAKCDLGDFQVLATELARLTGERALGARDVG